MKISTPVGSAIVAGALVVGGVAAYAQTNGLGTAQAGTPSASSFASSAAPSPTTSPPSSSPSATRSKSSSPTPSASTSSTTPVTTTLKLGAGTFGPVKLPADGDEARAALEPILGKPSEDTSGLGCELLRPRPKSRLLMWGDNLFLDGETTKGGVVNAWSVYGPGPVPFELPYGVTIGTSFAEAKAKIPGVRVAKDLGNEDYLVLNELSWGFGSPDGPTGKVTVIQYGGAPCD